MLVHGHLLRQNLRRNMRHMVLSAIGIVVGISAFVFFVGLSRGVANVVLKKIFPIDRIEVISPKTTITGFSRKLDDKVVEEIKRRPEVKMAFPKMKLAFPAKGNGELTIGKGEPKPLNFELGGFCDGMDPILIKGEPGAELFRDWDLDVPPTQACDPEAAAHGCPKDHYCGEDNLCHHRVPVLLSRTLIEFYNTSFAPSHGMEPIPAVLEDILKKNVHAVITLNESHVKATKRKKDDVPPEIVEAMVVGISDKAMPIGMTIPIGYVRRWNTKFAGEEHARQYSSIVTILKSQKGLSPFVKWVKQNGLEEEESMAKQISLVIKIVTTLFLIIAFTICGISAVNISHTFFMLVSERRREIGLMRAVGASKNDVAKIILGEAAVVGAAAGSLGVAIALVVAWLIDRISASKLPNYPFKPNTYFDFSPEIILGALGFAIAFCVMGAFLPARQAARIHPAQALSG